MKIVALVDRSAGNETVGEMWTETAVFDSGDSIQSVYDWVASRLSLATPSDTIINIKLSVLQDPKTNTQTAPF